MVSIELKDSGHLPDQEQMELIRTIANGLDFIPGISVRIRICTPHFRASFAWKGKPFATIIYTGAVHSNHAGKTMCFVGERDGANAGLFEDSPDQAGRRVAALLLDEMKKERDMIEKLSKELENQSPMCFWKKS